MKLYEAVQKVGNGLMLAGIICGVGGITFTAIGYIDECADLHKKNFVFSCAAEHLADENAKLKKQLEAVKDKVVETVTEVKEKVEA